MNELLPIRPDFHDSCELPAEVKTLNGAKFDPRADKWAYRDSSTTVKLDFGRLNATADFIYSIKIALIWYAENKSQKHMINMFERLVHMSKNMGLKDRAVSQITSNDLLNYKASLSKDKAWYLGNLSGFLQKWRSLGLPGVADDAVALLKQLRIKGNQKGEAVLTMDSENGPYTDIELEAIHSALEVAYENDDISLGDYLLVWLFMALGQRPIQYAALKVCDVGMEEAKDGSTMYTLQVPRAKQRGRVSRELFSPRVLIPQVGERLVQYANEVRSDFFGTLADPGQAPLFPAKISRQNEPVGFEYHMTSQSLSLTLSKILGGLNIVSERTGEQLHVTATRFRRTVGTRAAEEGHGELVIAELLDHTDTQNVGVYVQATPEIVKRIDKAVAMHMAPLAQAFAGVIISNESQATRRNDPTSRICDPKFEPSMKPMGNCGKHGFCDSLAPIACYTCRSFEPWLDGPHEAVLNHLIAERDRLMAGNDARIASINDRTILAVAEVVRRCEEIRSEESLIV
ncbi:site-specific integrase [Ferrovum sp.]|uniref:site-specific integrase n=1 Tax=Ferrovum sp. TaxID=2609467 RepID=UPI0026353F28|nr:site-specific integrase [Ferrovum sp.]